MKKQLLVSLMALASGSTFNVSAAPTQVYWGDTHLHTSYSGDAFAMGDETADPDTAYRFAKGQPVIHPYNRVRVQLDQPLDFLVVADHAEYMGLMQLVRDKSPLLEESDIGKQLMQMWDEKGSKAVFYNVAGSLVKGASYEELLTQAIRQPVWDKIIEAAEANNEPGTFTAFIGWEWTTMPGGNNLHRVVMFADDTSKTGQLLPFSSFDSEDPEELWKFLQRYEDKTGGRVLAIPHNGNVSNGLMFALTDRKGNPLTREHAETRSRWEPVMEVTQIKGDGETHPKLSPDDEFADFETWDKGNLIGVAGKSDAMLPYEYTRSALKLGLKQEAELGVNPFKYGMIGSSDAHTSLSTAEENNFWGKFSVYEPSADRAEKTPYVKGEQGKVFSLGVDEVAASGYAAVWATENTRDALFDAIKRRETYATTGPRMTVRFFGGWDFTADEVNYPDYVDRGYTKGVPMGADLTQAPAGKAPRFMVAASRDPEGANLDRVQIVKGWHDTDGSLQEKVYNVAWSDNRPLSSEGRLPAVGNTVSEDTATWRNSIGATELSSVWTDPDFDPAERAFYYVRVLQIPTPRWTLYDQKHFGSQNSTGMPNSIQERAYTSPIWYTPATEG